MATAADTITKTRGKALATIGIITTILAIIVVLIPLGITAYEKLTGGIELTTQDQIQTFATDGTILTIAAAALGLISLIICIIAVVLARKVMRTVVTILSLLVLISAVLFGALYLRPRINDLTSLNNTIEPFATSIRDDCGTPLNTTTNDLKSALSQTQAAGSDDATFAAAMQTVVPKLQADVSLLSDGSNKFLNVKVPDPKYQALYNDCASSLKGETDFLSNSAAIPLPAPYNKIVPSVSGIDLLKDAGLLAANEVPGLTLKPGTIEPLVAYVLQQVVNAPSNLGAEGMQLETDIRTRLTNDCSPFKVDADKIVS